MVSWLSLSIDAWEIEGGGWGIGVGLCGPHSYIVRRNNHATVCSTCRCGACTVFVLESLNSFELKCFGKQSTVQDVLVTSVCVKCIQTQGSTLVAIDALTTG